VKNYEVFDIEKNDILYLGRKEQTLEYQKWLFHKAKMLGDMSIFLMQKLWNQAHLLQSKKKLVIVN